MLKTEEVAGEGHTSIMRHRARIALARYNTSLATEVSFIIMLVDIMTSSAVFESSFKIRYTIWRKDVSLFWNNFEIPKNNVVASFVGNLSPVNRRTAILVRRVRHFRGEIGEELNSLAVGESQHQ
jgi:hypothetical protein